jgi:hypothetical protein
MLGFQCVTISKEGWLNIGTSYLVYSQIWLNLPRDDCHVFWVFLWWAINSWVICPVTHLEQGSPWNNHLRLSGVVIWGTLGQMRPIWLFFYSMRVIQQKANRKPMKTGFSRSYAGSVCSRNFPRILDVVFFPLLSFEQTTLRRQLLALFSGK